MFIDASQLHPIVEGLLLARPEFVRDRVPAPGPDDELARCRSIEARNGFLAKKGVQEFQESFLTVISPLGLLCASIRAISLSGRLTEGSLRKSFSAWCSIWKRYATLWVYKIRQA